MVAQALPALGRDLEADRPQQLLGGGGALHVRAQRLGDNGGDVDRIVEVGGDIVGQAHGDPLGHTGIILNGHANNDERHGPRAATPKSNLWITGVACG